MWFKYHLARANLRLISICPAGHSLICTAWFSHLAHGDFRSTHRSHPVQAASHSCRLPRPISTLTAIEMASIHDVTPNLIDALKALYDLIQAIPNIESYSSHPRSSELPGLTSSTEFFDKEPKDITRHKRNIVQASVRNSNPFYAFN